MAIFRFFSNLTRLVKWAIFLGIGLLILAVVSGLFNRTGTQPASVSLVNPAASQGQIAAARPAASTTTIAPSAATAPTPGAAAPVVVAGLLRSAQKIPPGTTFDACATETLGLPQNQDGYTDEGYQYTTAATRAECKAATLSITSKIDQAFASYAPKSSRAYIQITRSGLLEATTGGEYVVVLTAATSQETRCGLFVGDTAVPVLTASGWREGFNAVGKTNLETGHHETALTCVFLIGRGDTPGGVTVSIRAPGEDMPRLATLQTARTPVAAATPAATPSPAPATTTPAKVITK